MIVGGRIDSVEGKKFSDSNILGLNVNIAIDGVAMKGNLLEIIYTYTVAYDKDVGKLVIKGAILAEEEKKFAKDAIDTWQKDKKLPDSYAESILNAINYGGSANGTLIARVINLSPPLLPPRIQIEKAGKG